MGNGIGNSPNSTVIPANLAEMSLLKVMKPYGNVVSKFSPYQGYIGLYLIGIKLRGSDNALGGYIIAWSKLAFCGNKTIAREMKSSLLWTRYCIQRYIKTNCRDKFQITEVVYHIVSEAPCKFLP